MKEAPSSQLRTRLALPALPALLALLALLAMGALGACGRAPGGAAAGSADAPARASTGEAGGERRLLAAPADALARSPQERARGQETPGDESPGDQSPGQQAPTPTADVHARLRARAASGFGLVDFIKPRMDEEVGIDPYLGPILYREVGDEADAANSAARFGALCRGPDGGYEVDVERPTVYFARARVALAGVEREQLSFQWYFEGHDAQPPRAQGLRVTLNSAGFPALVEVLHDESGMHLLFASQALEAAAAASFGAALEGRAFSIEGARDESPESLVVELFREGPLPSGPMLYQPARGFDLWSLHCRCSPSRVSEVRELVEYELVPLAQLGAEARWSASLPGAGAEAELHELPDWWTQVLRLPGF